MILAGYCQCGCGTKTTVSKVNDRSKGWIKGVPIRYIKGHTIKGAGSGSANPRWNGGRYLSSHGYVVIWTAGGRQYEHISVAEKAVGRKLLYISPGHPMNEEVHHINGDKQNNSPNNLLVCTHRYHLELHHRLEASVDWPEFKKVIRNTKEKSRERYESKSV